MRSLNNIYTLLIVLFLGLSACEMKDELKRKNNSSDELGRLSLDLTVKDITKASGDPNNFPVTIVNKATNEVAKLFNTYAELLAQNPIELPVGTYSVTANTVGEYKAIMTYPYFIGNQEVKVEKDMSVEANVICKMQNIKFALTLSDNFKSTFKEYAVTVVNGATVYDFVETAGTGYEPVYFKIDNKTTQIDMKVIATTVTGVMIEYDIPLTKGSSDNGGEGNSLFEGGDALNIVLEPTDDPNPDIPTPEVPGVGVKVKVAFTFYETQETIEIEINGTDASKPENPDQPENPDPTPDEGAKPTMSCAFFDKPYTVGVDGDGLDVLITAPEGIKNLNLKVVSTEEEFSDIIATMGLADCDMANLSDELKEGLSNPEIGLISKDVEIKNQISYTFSIGAIVNTFLPNFIGTHNFTVEVVDNKGNVSESKTISIISQ